MKVREKFEDARPLVRTELWAALEAAYRPGLVAQLRASAAFLNLPPQGREYVRQAVEAPSRRVRSTAKSMAGAYASTKMGATIGFESRTVELPTVLSLEHDEDVFAYFNQAPSLNVRYKRNGRLRCYAQRPDFLVVRHGAVALIECKPLAQIELRNARDPGFYVQQGDRWTCPPLQEAARLLGLQHEVWTEGSFSQVRLRNLRMVGDYLLERMEPTGYVEARDALQRYLVTPARASVEQALEDLREDLCVDHLYAAIARGDVAFDWGQAPLVEPHRCFIYRDMRTLQAFVRSEQCRLPAAKQVLSAAVEVGRGVSIEWSGEIWRCVHADHRTVTLTSTTGHESLPRALVEDLIRSGAIKTPVAESTAQREADVHAHIAHASESDLRTANLRHRRIVPYLVLGAKAPTCRTVRRYLAKYRQAEAVYGNGFVGLIPGFSRSGNRTPRLMEAVLTIVMRIVEAHYLTAENKHALVVHGLVADECKAAHLPPPSYSWFCGFLKKIPAYRAKLARTGTKGAYALESRAIVNDVLDKTEPERPFERAHVDHTLLDVEVISGETSEPLGRCWLTVMIDHVSRRVLAFHLSFDPPSYRSVLMVMRKCVQRHGRLPESILVDGGKEFQSVWFETTAGLYRVDIKRRPTAKARFGSQGERLFGTSNTNLIHFLTGNTQLRKNVRQMTAEVDPSRSAVWTLSTLHGALTRYYFEVYDNLEHRELLMTPRFAFERGMERHGTRPGRLVAYNELFLITTSPAPDKKTAKIQPDGVKVHYIYYNHPSLQRHLGQSVDVRYDPFDKSIAWAFVDGAWLRLRTRHDRLLSGFTERDLDLATTEWRKRRSAVERRRLTQPLLIEFLKEITQTEALLLERKRASEELRLRQSKSDLYDAQEDGDTAVEPSASEPATEGSGHHDWSLVAPVTIELETLETL